MSFNGSGTFVINSAGQPVVANTVISATTFNALTADLANGLTTCITKDGQTTPTANIPMGGFKITNLATGTAATDAATVAQIQSNGAALVTVTGTDTLTGSLTPALVAYVTGAVYYFVAPATNTGAVTLNIDTLGAKNVTRDGTTALVAGDIVSGEMVAVVYDGTRFQLISPVNSFTNLNVSGTLTVAGATTLNGNLAVGDAAADTINFKSSGWTLTNNVSVTGTWADIGTITTADINGGTIDGTTIGGGTAAAGTFTTATATTGNITTVNATTVDSTNLEVSNLKAKDGTAAGSIADATGVVTLNSVVATTADINGGTIDATTIGGSSPAVGNFTTVSAASAVFTTATITTVNTTTLDLTNLEVTNIKAKDGTASMTIDDATGKVNVTTVSAASMNAGVAAVTSLTATGASVASANVGTAVITNGTVTALTATGASIASMNAGVALLTTATVTNFTASGASIASANIGNLQFTAASIASINAGVAVITDLTATSASVASANLGVAVVTTGTVTNLTATGASIASANVGTAVITAATVTGASIASMNAGVALLTTATVTNLTATGASIASANVGTLALTRLDVAAASVASANAGVAVITTGTVTNLTSTSASIASMNAGVALLTTATVTNLTATGASVASANVGTAVVTGLTVTGASIASVNAGTATLSGNLTLNGGTASGVVYLNGSKVATSGSALVFDGSRFGVGVTPSQTIDANGAILSRSNLIAYTALVLQRSSSSLELPVAAYTNGSGNILSGGTKGDIVAFGNVGGDGIIFANSNTEQMRLTSTGLGIGTSSPAHKLDILGNSAAVQVSESGGAAVRIAAGGSSGFFGTYSNHPLQFLTNSGTKATLDTSGNLGLGVTPAAGVRFDVRNDSTTTLADMRNANASGYGIYIAAGSSSSQYVQRWADYNNNALATLDASGNLGLGTTSPVSALHIQRGASAAAYYAAAANNATLATSGFLIGQDAAGLSRIYQYGSNPMTFWINDTERGRFSAGGYFKASDAGTYLNSTSNYHELRSSNNSATVVITNTNGSYTDDLIYGNTSTAAGTGFKLIRLDSNSVEQFRVRGDGTIFAQNTTVQSLSDLRLKENISDANDGLSVITALRPVRYDWKTGYGNNRKNQLGFIAQEVETVFPDAVSVWEMDEPTGEVAEDGEPITEKVDYKTVGPGALIPVLVKAMQEQQAMIETLKAKVAALEAK